MKISKRKRAKFMLSQLIFNIDYNVSRFIHHTKDCENCKYFGGLMCDHVDENNKCLGWEKYKRRPIKTWLYKRKIKKLAKKLRNNPSFEHFLKK